MKDQSIPHESWAKVYDLAYERSFGPSYEHFNEQTLAVISRFLPSPKSTIVDFGAGTGRISIPLANMGHSVTAVDRSQAMLDQLILKNNGLQNIETACVSMADFNRTGYDCGLCVFTVILYLLDEDSLYNSLNAAYTALKPDGVFIIDIPSRAVFKSYQHQDDGFKRHVTIESIKSNIFQYNETIELIDSQNNVLMFNDQFMIRYWSFENIKSILEKIGFIIETDLTSQFAGMGATYLQLRKPPLLSN